MKKTPTYIDIDMSFNRHPITKDIMKVTDLKAIFQSLKILVQTHATEMLMDPEIDGSLDHMMFRGNNNLTAVNIKNKVSEVINLHEPRIEVRNIEVYSTGGTQSQELFVRIEFHYLNINELQTIEIPVSRTR